MMSWFIVCIGVSTPPPPSKTPPLFLAKTPFKLTNCPSPPFLNNPPVKSSPPFLEIWLEVQPPWRKELPQEGCTLCGCCVKRYSFRFVRLQVHMHILHQLIIYKTFQMCYSYQHACLLVCLSLLSACLSVKFPRMIQVTRKKQGNS